MTNTTLIAKSTWSDGRVDIDTIIYTAEEMAEIFLPNERPWLAAGWSSAEVARASATSTPRRWR